MTLFCGALLSFFGAQITSGLDLGDAGPQLWLPHHRQTHRDVSLAHLSCGHAHPFLGLRAHLGSNLAETIISARYLPEGSVMEKLIVILALFPWSY